MVRNRTGLATAKGAALRAKQRLSGLPGRMGKTARTLFIVSQSFPAGQIHPGKEVAAAGEKMLRPGGGLSPLHQATGTIIGKTLGILTCNVLCLPRAPDAFFRTAAACSPPRHLAVQAVCGFVPRPSQEMRAGPRPASPDPPCCSRTQQPSWDH
jgi:hypothetical protein